MESVRREYCIDEPSATTMEPEKIIVGMLRRRTKEADISEGEAPVSNVKRILNELRDPGNVNKEGVE
jgi:hypothetical protein